MLRNGRDEMCERAVAAFKAQTYERKRLLIWDTGKLTRDFDSNVDDVTHVPAEAYREITIGALRNEANECVAVSRRHEIIAHWDSDDWSHPRRLEEQVELLERSGKECVGYNECLFWKLCQHCRGFTDYCADVALCEACKGRAGEAWLYRLPLPGYALGTSLMYWRKAWERNPFQDTSNGEDTVYLRKVSCASASAMLPDPMPSHGYDLGEPRMIATIHGGNTSKSMVIDPVHSEWKRVPEWDAHVRSIMEGA